MFLFCVTWNSTWELQILLTIAMLRNAFWVCKISGVDLQSTIFFGVAWRSHAKSLLWMGMLWLPSLVTIDKTLQVTKEQLQKADVLATCWSLIVEKTHRRLAKTANNLLVSLYFRKFRKHEKSNIQKISEVGWWQVKFISAINISEIIYVNKHITYSKIILFHCKMDPYPSDTYLLWIQ